MKPIEPTVNEVPEKIKAFGDMSEEELQVTIKILEKNEMKNRDAIQKIRKNIKKASSFSGENAFRNKLQNNFNGIACNGDCKSMDFKTYLRCDKVRDIGGKYNPK